MSGHAIRPALRVRLALVNKSLLAVCSVAVAPMLLIAPLAMAMAGAHGAEAACKR